MKIRNGFVSNSSTSSFLVLGMYMKAEELTPEIMGSKLVCPFLCDEYEGHKWDDTFTKAEKETDSFLVGKDVEGKSFDVIVEVREAVAKELKVPVEKIDLESWSFYNG